MLGKFDTMSVRYGSAEANYVQYRQNFFVQDEFKLTPRFTLTVGLRYEPYLAPRQKYGFYTVNNLADMTVISKTHPDALPGTLFPGDQFTPSNGKLQYDDLNNFGPGWALPGMFLEPARPAYEADMAYSITSLV